MDSNELLKLGEFYKELRIARKVKQKDVAKNKLSVSQLSKFESGQTMLSADKMLEVIEGINLTFSEFGFALRDYKVVFFHCSLSCSDSACSHISVLSCRLVSISVLSCS